MKLTDEQIAELAPDWAEFYLLNAKCEIVPKVISFYDSTRSRAKWFYLDSNMWSPDSYSKIHAAVGIKPIPRKPFDIEEYEFSDIFGSHHSSADGNVYFTAIELGRKVKFSIAKEDAIALAKHFKLTTEDLK